MNKDVKTCLLALVAALGMCAWIAGAFCLGISLIQLLFGTGHNIVMAYWGLSLIIAGRTVAKLATALDN